MSAAGVRHHDVVCPFCALGCDDLVIDAEGAALRVIEGAPPRCAAAFEVPAGEPGPRIGGQPATLEAAVARAAAILGTARAPLLHGLEGDTAAIRAALRLAEATGATLDHAGAGGFLANLRVMQAGGWVTATLAEVRARADLVVLFGTDTGASMPRFAERVVWPRGGPPATIPGRPSGTAEGRRVVIVGDGLDGAHLVAPDGTAPVMIGCPRSRLAEAAAVLRAAATGRPLGMAAPELPTAALMALGRDLAAARYAVIAWALPDLPPAEAELTAHSLAELTKALNAPGRAESGRVLGLPLAGPGNIVGAGQVVGWSWGVPLRSSVASGGPDHDPEAMAAGALLAGGGADALLWLSAFSSAPPPFRPGLPTIALVRSAGGEPVRADVVIPVGVPGLDHGGAVFRTDSVVALPLRPLRAPTAPAAADVLDAIRAALPRNTAGLPGAGAAAPC